MVKMLNDLVNQLLLHWVVLLYIPDDGTFVDVHLFDGCAVEGEVEHWPQGVCERHVTTFCSPNHPVLHKTVKRVHLIH